MSDAELQASLEILDLLPSRGKGRGAHEVGLYYVRDLVPADVHALAVGPVPGGMTTIPATLRLRQAHHTLARLIAEGASNPEISAITGYAPATISRLRSDPAMKELIEYYAGQAAQQFLDVHSRLATLGTTAVEILQEKLEETPVEQLSIKTVREIAEFALDRSIAPPKGPKGGTAVPGQSAGVTLNVSFVAPAPGPGPVIEGTVLRDEGPEGGKESGEN